MSTVSSCFNLIDEAWIPVRFLDGRRAELGIKETLLRAKEIAVIEDASPLVTAALHRFLLAVLYRALEGPTDIDQAKGWFKTGLPADKIGAYLERWRDRFWLFDEKYPFFQTPGFEPKTWRAWTALAAEHNADNAKVLFDHIDVNHPGAIPPEAAARWLLATQTFSVSAGKSELSHTSDAPSATAVMALPLGQNLEDTLLLNLVPQNRAVLAGDLPVWEREPESVDSLKAGAERSIAGYADRYTWRARSIRLRGDASGNVSTLAFASGVKNASKDGIDPMLAYRIDKKNGKLPIQFQERGLWRDFDSLLPDSSKLAPEVIEHATALTKDDRARFPHAVMVLGQANDQAKIEFWRQERFALPKVLLGDGSIRNDIRQLLSEAEEGSESLRLALWKFYRHLLIRNERKREDDLSKKEKATINRMADESWPLRHFWSTLEAAFHDLLHQYTIERDPDAIRCDWLKTVLEALRDAWAQHAAIVSTGDAWAIRALVKAKGTIVNQKRALSNEIKKYERYTKPQKETA